MIGRKKNRGVRDRQVHDHISEVRMSTQAGRQTGRQTDRQVDRQAGRQAGR